MTYVLVDFENVQPKNLAVLRDRPIHLKVFVGSQQSRVPFEMVQAVQALGAQAEYLQIAGNGPNALDLHIAYYIGRLAAQHPDAQFFILSKDRDYDILIKHLLTRHVHCKRIGALEEIPAPAASGPDRLAPVITYLRNLKASRPRKLKTLSSTLKARFVKDGGDREVQALVVELLRRGAISVNGTDVTYQFDT